MLKRFIRKQREAFDQILLKQIKNNNVAIIEYRSYAQFAKSVFFHQPEALTLICFMLKDIILTLQSLSFGRPMIVQWIYH